MRGLPGATRMESELRVAGEETLGVWGGLNAEDRLPLIQVWRGPAARGVGGTAG